MTHAAPETATTVFQKYSKAIYAGVSGGVAAFVPLASGATHWAIVSDIVVAVATGVFTAVVTLTSPANKS